MPLVTRAPFAPASLMGLGNTAPQGTPYPDQSYDIPVDIVMTGNQVNLVTNQTIERDADYVWRGVVINSYTDVRFKVQFNINGWYNLSPTQINAGNYQSDPGAPYPIWPELTVPAGGRIQITTTDFSGSTNTIQIVLRGVKRFKQGQQ